MNFRILGTTLLNSRAGGEELLIKEGALFTDEGLICGV